MRLLARLSLVFALLACAGCRRGSGEPVDPSNPDALPACPEGAHIVIGVRAPGSDATQAILRYTPELAPCRGALLPANELGTLSAVAPLSDGADLVGFQGSYAYGGALVRVDGATVTSRVEDPDFTPISIASVAFDGQRAAAVVWGAVGGSSDDGERLDLYAEADLAPLASFEIPGELTRVANPPSGEPSRIAGLIGGGMQEHRHDLGALATTGELRVAAPSGIGYLRSLHVSGDRARATSSKGVLSWRLGMAPAFLGPVHCRWPDTVDTPLPAEDADYGAAVIDPRAPDDTLVIVHGELEGSEGTTHLFALRPHGECRLIASTPSGYHAAAIGAP